ncbi:MAG: small multi-drug export protein [Desulfurococcaceae archaeon]
MNSVDLIIIALLAFMPISEIRGAIPYAMYRADSLFHEIIGISVSIAFNMLVPFAAFFILDLLDKLIKSKHVPVFLKKAYLWLINLGVKRSLRMRKTSYIALALFVGVPLPVTGAWTGTLVSFVLGLDRRKSIIAIEIGVLIASVIVAIVTYTGIEVLKRIFLS